MGGDKAAENQWRSKYLGSIFEAGDDQMPDVMTRIARAKQWFGKMRHIWGNKELHKNLRMRLCKSRVCSILTYGSEAWRLTPKICAALNGANSSMVSQQDNRQSNQGRGDRREDIRSGQMDQSQEASVVRPHFENGQGSKDKASDIRNVQSALAGRHAHGRTTDRLMARTMHVWM